jgi:choline kinase
MTKCVLIQANGDGTRMKDYFQIAKHHLFYKGSRIIEQIVSSVETAKVDCYIASKYTENVMFNSIHCKDTKNRIETIEQCLEKLASYDTIIVHDCDVLFNHNTITAMEGNMISVAHYKGDGLKYGFIEVDQHFKYKSGNEKRTEAEYITSGLYSFETKRMKQFIEKNNGLSYDSLLAYYNVYQPQLLYTNNHTNLGDIDSYMQNL